MLAIYCRISRLKEEGKDRSIPDQTKSGIEMAMRLGIDYELFIDEGITAASDDISLRPEYIRMLEWINAGKITGVFAFDLSRLEREPIVRFELIKELKKNNVKLYTEVDGFIDIEDPQKEFFGDLMSVINKYQVTMTRIKVRSVINRRVLEGKAHGVIQYGYTTDENGFLGVHEEEAKVVLLIFDLSYKGMGTRSIAEYLNNNNVPTRYNKIGKGTITVKNKYTKKSVTRNKSEVKWAGNTVMNILTNPIYFGKRFFGKKTTTLNEKQEDVQVKLNKRYDGKKVHEVPAIMTQDYWQMINDNVKNNSNTRGKKVTHAYLLKGMIRCGICSRNMYGRTRVSKKDNYYMCSSKRIKNESCGNRSINIDRLDNFIWGLLFGKENFIERLEKELLFKGEDKHKILSEVNNERRKLESLKTEKQKSISLCSKGIISEEDLSENVKSLNIEIKKAEEQIRTLEKSESRLFEDQAKIQIIKDKFVDYTRITNFIQKKKVIDELIKNIVITFTNHNYYLVEIEYKFGLPKETWKTSNEHAKYFYKMLIGEDGEDKGVLFHCPKPISNPEDDTAQKRLLKYMGPIDKL